MIVIGVQNIVGGAGATTVCAGLSCALTANGMRAIALDLNADNTLGVLYGMPLNSTQGLLSQRADPIREQVYESLSGYPFIPFGRQARQQEADAIQSLPRTLPDRLAPLLTMTGRILVVDLPQQEGPLHTWVYEQATVILNVLVPDPRLTTGLLRFARTQRVAQEQAGSHPMVLLNQVAPRLELNRDSTDYLRAQLHPEALVPVQVHRDQHLPEAMARQEPLRDLYPEAQATADFDALALWLQTYLSNMEEA